MEKYIFPHGDERMNVKSFFTAAVVSVAVLGVSLSAAQEKKAKAAPAKKAAAGAGRTIEITGDDTMKFSVTAIDAKPGETLTVKLTNKGTMPKIAAAHNFVLLKKGTDLNAFTTAAVMAQSTDYIPAKFKDEIIANTKLAGPGETVETTFKAPTAPGTYQFICSFPGHFATMKGTLTVK
jgi:azurin